MRSFFKALQSFTLLLGSVCVLSTSVYGQFDVVFDLNANFSPSQVAVFNQVESAIESQILGYRPGVTLSGAVVDVNLEMIDEQGGIAAQGGGIVNPSPGNLNPAFSNGGFEFHQLATNPTVGGSTLNGTYSSGIVNFDTADLPSVSDATLFDLFYHETVHALGFGGLFAPNNLVDANGQYIGALGLSTFQNEFNTTATSIPTDGTTPTNVFHFDENSVLGSDILSPELALDGNNTFSDTHIAVFQDLGYIVSVSVPEPSSLLILASAGLLLLGRRRVV